MVIVEYCKYGNLSNFLRAKREAFSPYAVSRRLRWGWAQGASAGVGRRPLRPAPCLSAGEVSRAAEALPRHGRRR